MPDYYRLLNACRSPDWRAIMALTRIGGLRAPSELIQSLRWEDINWETGWLLVKCKKTKRYAGKDMRMVPLFPELRTVLEELYALRSPNAGDPVILQYTDPKANLCTEFGRIHKRSGVEPFSRPFDNMRASRAIEVYQFFGEWEESRWIGHSRATARKHYLRMQPQHFSEAAKWKTPVDWSDAEKPDITPTRDMDSEEGFLR